MDKSETYQEFANHTVKEIPTEAILNSIVDSFYFEAAMNMGMNTKNRDCARDVSRIVYLLKSDFAHLPISLVASAFMRGSLGKLDQGRLVPRTVYNWLSEVSREYMDRKKHEELQEKLKVPQASTDLFRFPLGQAIIKKMDWLKSGVITEEDWDHIPMKAVAERIATGMLPVPELFVVKTKNKEAI